MQNRQRRPFPNSNETWQKKIEKKPWSRNGDRIHSHYSWIQSFIPSRSSSSSWSFLFFRFVCYLASHAIPPWTQWPPFPFYLWSTIVTDRVPFYPDGRHSNSILEKDGKLDLQKWGGNDINHSWRKSVASWLSDNQLNDQFKRAPLPSKRHTDRHLWVVIDSIY